MVPEGERKSLAFSIAVPVLGKIAVVHPLGHMHFQSESILGLLLTGVSDGAPLVAPWPEGWLHRHGPEERRFGYQKRTKSTVVTQSTGELCDDLL